MAQTHALPAPADEPAPPPDAPPGFVASLGGLFVGLARSGAEIYGVLVRTLYYSVRGRREPGAVLAQMYEIGNKSLFFLTVVMGFIGMILVLRPASRPSAWSPISRCSARRTSRCSSASSRRRSAR
jgi:hypothetical protein